MLNTIKTDATPLSVALSRETPTPRYLYVACYDGSTLDIIDLNSANFTYVAKQLDASVDVLMDPHGTKVSITHATFASRPNGENGSDFMRRTA